MNKLIPAAFASIAIALPAVAQKAVTNLTTGDEFTGLSAALNAVSSGDVLQINSDISISSTINPADKEITLIGANPEVTIHVGQKADGSFPVVFNINNTGGVTVKDLVFDLSAGESATNFIQQSNGKLSIDNVTIKDYTTSVENGCVRVYSKAAATEFNNLTFENCSMPESAPYDILYAVENSKPTLSGNCDFTVRLNNTSAALADGGISDGSRVVISYSSHTSSIPVVYGTTDISLFSLSNDTQMLAPQGDDLYAVNYAKILLVNDTENGKESKGFANLNGSSGAGAAAAENAEIILNENIDLGGSINLYGKTVTIRGASPDVTVNMTASVILANAGAANTHITLKDLAVDGSSATDYSNYVAQASVANSSVAINNVRFKNFSNGGTAMLRANNGVWSLDNVSFENCEMTSGNPLVLTNNTGCSVSGIIDGLTLAVNNPGATTIDAEGLSAESQPIAIKLSGAYTHDSRLITNCEDTSLFELTNSGWSLQADNGGIKILENRIVTGISNVVTDNEGPAEYYDFQGRRVQASALTPGIYICRKGGKAIKTVVR
ncbi:MAG: hypothetical protein K2G30_08965 [Muribaculaceae bacterium]|nr:hypothetical protein [Muribaculaceae bacterium]